MVKLRKWWQNTVQFLASVRQELRKVTWPTRQQTILYTAVVVISVAIVSGAMWVMDELLRLALRALLQLAG